MYVDTVHYSAALNKLLAGCIVEGVLVPPKAAIVIEEGYDIAPQVSVGRCDRIRCRLRYGGPVRGCEFVDSSRI